MPNGPGRFRNQCHECWNRTQRLRWAANRSACRATRRASYAKHAARRRTESAAYKSAHREYYTLAEWFRRKGIPIKHIDPAELTALVDMKRAIKQLKAQIENHE